MDKLLQTPKQELIQAFNYVWDKLYLFYPRDAMAIANGVIGILVLMVGYESTTQDILGVHTLPIPWQTLPSLLIFCMYLLANPLRQPVVHALATLPLLSYGVFMMGQVWAGRVEVEHVLPATYTFMFAVSGMLIIRRYYDEDKKDRRIAELECKLNKTTALLNQISKQDFQTILQQAAINEPTASGTNA